MVYVSWNRVDREGFFSLACQLGQAKKRNPARQPGAARHGGPGFRLTQILPTRSSEGARVASPSSHLAGQTSPGWAATYWAALILRSRSAALRPIPSAVISTAWMM